MLCSSAQQRGDGWRLGYGVELRGWGVMTHGELGLVSCQLGHTSCWGECREHGETCLTYLSLTAPRLIVQLKDTPLMYAAQNESEHSAALAKVLVGAGAKVNATDDVSAIGCN